MYNNKNIELEGDAKQDKEPTAGDQNPGKSQPESFRRNEESDEMTRSPSRSSSEGKAPAAVPESEAERPRLCCSYRMLISFGGFLTFFNSTLIRVGTVMAMICMAEPRSRNVSNDPECPKIKSNYSSDVYEFKWSSSLQGIINSGGFYGFLVGPFVAGFLCYRFGGKIVLLIGTFSAACLNLLIPELTRINPYIFFGTRILIGFFGGWLFPSAYDILSHWTLPDERQILAGGALIGVPTYAAINYPLNGMICKFMGWEWIFYISSIWLVLCSVFLAFFVYDNPETCPFAKSEIDYILPRTPVRSKTLKIPWRKILRSLPLYAYMVTHFCMNYTLITVTFHLPVFMQEVHHFELSSNSFLSASPFIGSLFCRTITTFTFERLRNRLKLTRTFLRKIFVIIGVVIPSTSLIVICFLPCKYRYVTIAIFILFSTTFELCFASGYLLSLMDMTPSYNNVLSGIANTLANFAGLFSALITGFLTPNGIQEEWNRVFSISVGCLVIAGISYIFFGTSELQPWGLVSKEDVE